MGTRETTDLNEAPQAVSDGPAQAKDNLAEDPLLGAHRSEVGKLDDSQGNGSNLRRSVQGGRSAPSMATQLVELTESAGTELIQDKGGTAYAALEVKGHRVVWKLDSKEFRTWLSFRYYEEYGVATGLAPLEDSVRALTGKAQYEGQTRDVHVRVAEQHGRIYLDLGDERWRAAEIDPTGWRILDRPPVYFRRPQGMLSLPEPVRGGTVNALRSILNVGDDEQWILIQGWLLGTLYPLGPKPILLLHGEQGSGKSTTAKGLRSLVDPNNTQLRSSPRSERDLAVSCNNNWVLAYDNLSSVRPWFSDALCQMCTGGGFSTRALYTDDQETVFNVTRPVLLNGIASEMADRPDLLDRALVVGLKTVEGRRRTEAEIQADLDKARPRILGALLDAVSTGLGRLNSVQLTELPRMADLAKWVEACGLSLGWQPGAFVRAFKNQKVEMDAQTLGMWPVYEPLQQVLTKKNKGEWKGTVSQLLTAIRTAPELAERSGQHLPKSPRQLGSELRQYAPLLKRLGMEVQLPGRGSQGYRVEIRSVGKPKVAV